MKKLWSVPVLEELDIQETACWPFFPWFPQKPQKPQKPCFPPFRPTWPFYPPCGSLPESGIPGNDETESLS